MPENDYTLRRGPRCSCHGKTKAGETPFNPELRELVLEVPCELVQSLVGSLYYYNKCFLNLQYNIFILKETMEVLSFCNLSPFTIFKKFLLL